MAYIGNLIVPEEQEDEPCHAEFYRRAEWQAGRLGGELDSPQCTAKQAGVASLESCPGGGGTSPPLAPLFE